MSDDPAEESSNEDDPSERDDPFDRLGYDTEREGDLFERLDDDTPAESAGQDASISGDPWGSPDADEREAVPDDTQSGPDTEDPESAGVTDPDAVRSPTPEGSTDHAVGDDTGDPFADVETPTENPFSGSGSVFERVDSGSTDPDQVWERITGEDDAEGGDDDDTPMPDDGRYSEVSKHTFCERCEHFSPPPNVTCTHDTAEIIEFLDMETVRLLDCPVVAEREELEQE